MTAGIATSYLGNNQIAPERVKDVILSIHEALREVHDITAGLPIGSGIKDPVASTGAGNGATSHSAAPAEEHAREIRETAVPETRPEPSPQTAIEAEAIEAPALPAARARQRRRVPMFSVPVPLADGGRLRRRPRLEAVAGGEDKAKQPEVSEPAKTVKGTQKTAAVSGTSAVATSAKQPELALEQQAERQSEGQPWAITELGLEPTYSPRSKAEIARIRKAVFVPEYGGKTGGFVRCLEDGEIRRMLKKHLKFLEIPPAEYLAKWGLPADFPLVHPEFSASRANQIKTAGLWEQRRAVRAKRGETVDFEAPNVKEMQRRERQARKAAKAA